MQYEFDRYYTHQFTTLKESRNAVVNTTELPVTYYREILHKSACACTELNLEKNDILLEIGLGIGDVSKLLSKTVKYLHCCDVNKSLLSMAEVNCQDCNNISFHCNLDYQEKPLKFLDDNSINKALAHSVFIHCDTDTILQYVNELHRVLKPGGLVSTMFNKLEKREPDLPTWQTYVDHAKILETIKDLNFEIINHDIFIQKKRRPGDSKVKVPVISLILKKK